MRGRLRSVVLAMVMVTTGMLLFVAQLGAQEQAPAKATEEGTAPDAAAPAEAEAAPEPPDTAADDYVSRCSGCHTIGSGKLTGPDLVASTKWPDADLSAAVLRMQPKTGPITAAEAMGLVELLKDAAVKERLAAASQRLAQRFAAKLDSPSAALGKALFRGSMPLAKQGLPCASCHRAGSFGGELGPDLSSAFSKMGQIGLFSACENTNFDVMRTAYRDHPVSKQEALHLTEYLKTVAESEPAGSSFPVLWVGLALAAVVLGLGSFYQRPPRRSARARLVQEAQRR